MKDFLSLEENKLNIKYFILLMLLAFIFSMSVRYIWVDMFNDTENFKWNNEVMINTNDGYYYAEGTRDILSGTHQENDLSPIDAPLAKLTSFLTKILPISFETLILWMPGVFGSLLVLPIMLIARVFKKDVLGFCAALLGGIAWSYYNRTMIGYYDTDLLVVVLPSFAVWGVIYALNHEDTDSFLIAPIFALFSMYWHGGTGHIIIGLFFMTLFYTFIFQRRNLYYYKFLSVFILAISSLPLLIKVPFMVGLVIVYHLLKEKLTEKVIIGIVIISTITYLIFGGFDWIVGILNNAYVSRLLHADEIDFSLKYFGVVNTVREAGHIPFETFANRISGHTITFWLSIVGYLLFTIRHRLMILSLPMVVLGFFALQGGLRFTVFSVPFMALGVMYLIFLFAKYFEMLFAEKIKVLFRYIFITFCTIGVLYPNIKHVLEYRVPTVFVKEEVLVLDKLKSIASREDYVISWWDYGYPIRYHADVKTIIDGAKHDGGSNFPVSFALTNNQIAAANIARLDVEFTERGFKKPCGPSIECMLKAYNIKNPNEFLRALNNKNLQKPIKTRDIYFYLPNRMLNVFPTIDMFSNLELTTGIEKNRPLFYMSKNFKDNGKTISLGKNIIIHKEGGKIQFGKKVVSLKHFVVTSYNGKGQLTKNVQTVNPQATISVIYMKDYKQFLVLDDRMYNSSYIQLFALENYDNTLFEPVILSPLAKVFKLKI